MTYLRPQPRMEWWQVLAGCVLEALLLDVLRRGFHHEPRWARWPH